MPDGLFTSLWKAPRIRAARSWSACTACNSMAPALRSCFVQCAFHRFHAGARQNHTYSGTLLSPNNKARPPLSTYSEEPCPLPPLERVSRAEKCSVVRHWTVSAHHMPAAPCEMLLPLLAADFTTKSAKWCCCRADRWRKQHHAFGAACYNKAAHERRGFADALRHHIWSITILPISAILLL